MKAMGILTALFLVFWRFQLRLWLALRLKKTRLGYVLWLEGGLSAGFFQWQGLWVKRLAPDSAALLPGKGQKWLRPAWLLRLPFRQLEGETVLGLGEAAATAIACGVLWSVAGAVAAAVAPGRARLNITPDYQQKRLQLQGQCIISLSIAQIMGRTLAAVMRKGRWKTAFSGKKEQEHGTNGTPH